MVLGRCVDSGFRLSGPARVSGHHAATANAAAATVLGGRLPEEFVAAVRWLPRQSTEATMSERNDWNQKVIDEFRANGGRVGGQMEGWPLLLLHHVGARSGIERVTPVVYQRLGESGSVAVFASKAGAPTNPDWFHNLVANPETSIEIGAETRQVRARVAAGDDRERIWEAQKRVFPNFAEYEKTAGAREIPVVILEQAV